jgi:hypothetical protein
MKHANITTSQSKRATERRTKLRLRELCDEVLASYHQARGDDLFSNEDRNAARQVMTSVLNRQ